MLYWFQHRHITCPQILPIDGYVYGDYHDYFKQICKSAWSQSSPTKERWFLDIHVGPRIYTDGDVRVATCAYRKKTRKSLAASKYETHEIFPFTSYSIK